MVLVAANGVVMVTTKRGNKKGEGTLISYAGSVSVASRSRKMDLMNSQEWCDAFMTGIENENKWGSHTVNGVEVPFNWSNGSFILVF